MPDVSMSLQAGGKKASEKFSPNVGGAIETGFQPGKLKFSVDYSLQRGLVNGVGRRRVLAQGRWNGIPLLKRGRVDRVGWVREHQGSGGAWEIAKQVEAKAEVDYSKRVHRGQ